MAKRKNKRNKKKDKQKLKVPNKKAVSNLKAIAICGHVEANCLLSHWSARGIRTFESEGLIEKVTYVTGKEVIEAYKLTDSGARYVKKYVYDEAIYRSKSIIHDLAMSDRYYSLTDEERDSVKTESQLRRELEVMYSKGGISEEDYKNASCVDFSYTSQSGEVVGFEVITKNYTKAEILAKQSYCSCVGMTFEGVRV